MKHQALALLSSACVLLLPSFALADIADAVNEVRSRGCGRINGIETPLRTQRALSAAAKRLSRGDSLDQALMSSGYRAKRSASLSLSGNTKDDAIANTLGSQFCAQIMEPAFRDIGFHDDGDAVWMIVAAPFALPSNRDAEKISKRVLELTNAARSRGGRCGSAVYAPSNALSLNDKLERAAHDHSRDLASRSLLSHQGNDGTKPADRALRAGYRWRVVGENVAAGPVSAEEVMQGWLASAQHCSNILDARYSEMAVSFVIDEKSKGVIYWTQMFATPAKK